MPGKRWNGIAPTTNWPRARAIKPTLRSGHFFDLTEHPRKACNDLWLLLSVSHHVANNPRSLEEAITSDVKPADGFTQGYRNTLQRDSLGRVLSSAAASRARRVLVSQTARVTGPAGEEIYCDEYRPGQGRVPLGPRRTQQ